MLRAGVRRLPGPARPDGHLHAREDSDAEDFINTNFQSSSLAEDPRERADSASKVNLNFL